MFETASLVESAARLIEWQVEYLGPVGVGVLAVAGLLWTCSTWFVAGEWGRLRTPRRR
jgi:hypothetical protein